jgi:YidC/Oxa1 family membrane protein insertase
MMLIVMPVMVTVMFYQFASGLVLYWFVSTLLGIGQQVLTNRGKA